MVIERVKAKSALGRWRKTYQTYGTEGLLTERREKSTAGVRSRRIRWLGLVQSMSRRGNCLDNVPIESFFGHLKDHVDYYNSERKHGT